MKKFKIALFTLITLSFLACNNTGNDDMANASKFSIDYEKYELENGLDVILHEDKSDPIVAIAVVVHAGSNRETPGRTGFAHFFEHMLFKKSENVPEGYFMDKISEWGGTRNGTTDKDRTLYFETVPNNALEKLLWMEADRLGFFINAVEHKAFETEKQVVKNEKRQRVDNVPYGHTDYVTIKSLYPENHPYNWTTIGELEDLQNATLDDVKSFYDKWYGPQNATLVIAGDFDNKQTKEWIEKYFGEIKKHGVEAAIEPMPITLTETKSLYHEDEFASLPRLILNFPTVERYHPDEAALELMANLLSSGKSSPLYKKVVLEEDLATQIYSYHIAREIAGRFAIQARAKEGIDLDVVNKAIFEALDDFETNGVTQQELDRAKADIETNFYNGMSGVEGKSFSLAHANMYTGDPAYLEKELHAWQSVSLDDIYRVYHKYVKNKHYVVTSFVPAGQAQLALEGSKKASVKVEPITPYVPEEIATINKEYTKTPTSFDRSIEPQFGPDPKVKSPNIWNAKMQNGLNVYGIKSSELPLVTFSLKIKGGKLLEAPSKSGTANVLTKIMQEGTKSKTPEELENAMKDLGASFNIYVGNGDITLTANCLSKNYHAVLNLMEEVLLEPRWDENEFARIKTEVLTSIKQRNTNPSAIATMVRHKLLFGDTPLAHPIAGSLETVDRIKMQDVKAYYAENFAPNISSFHIVGSISKELALSSLKSLEKKWRNKEVVLPSFENFDYSNSKGKVHLIDIPGAKQSQLNIARLTVPGKDNLPITIANYQLGAGSHGYLFKELRVKNGYTYGAYSWAIKNPIASQHLGSAAVRTNVTKESIEAYNDVYHKYKEEFNEEDLLKTKNSFLREAARDYETLNDLLGILHNISTNELSLDYIDTDQEVIRSMTLEKTKELINQYIDPTEMIYIVVGDKETQYERLKELGMGNPILLDKYGNEIEDKKIKS